ncbi:hypothetical protein niasHT_033338 [Heterodera trifolii]|uniref:Uncharacterized protein n=1 Tax=Heterodera trifolii TaxID=157864 RepID=A0ABD2IA86_9BILA
MQQVDGDGSYCADKQVNDYLGSRQQEHAVYFKDRTNFGEQNIRRSSSLQLPSSIQAADCEQKSQRLTDANFNFIHSALCTLKSSSASIYASTLSAAGLLGGVGLGGFRSNGLTGSGTTEADNLYMMMTAYRCCFGFIRLRMAAMLVGLFICISSTLMLCSLLFHSPMALTTLFSIWQYQLINRPAILLCFVSLFAGLLLLLALATDKHFLIIPFLFSCILNMMGSVALGLVLLMNPLHVYLSFIRHFGTFAELIPAFMALCTSVMVMINFWFLVLGAFTYVLIRDKRSLFVYKEEYFNNGYMDEEKMNVKLVMIRRSSSAPINRMYVDDEYH